MMRKLDGDILYFQGLSTLQKWIVDRTVTRQDEISKTGKKWKPLGEIGELSSFFLVADSIEGIERGDVQVTPPSVAIAASPERVAASAELLSREPVASEPPVREPVVPAETPAWATSGLQDEFVDPMEAPPPAQPEVKWSEPVQEPSGDWSIGEGEKGKPSMSMSLDMATELAPPEPLEASRAMGGTYDDPLGDDGGRSKLPVVLLLLIVLALVGLGLVYAFQPSWLGIGADDTAVPVADAGRVAAIVETPDAGTSSVEVEAAAEPPPVVKKKSLRPKVAVEDSVRGKRKPSAKDTGAGGGGFDASIRRARKNLNAGKYADALADYKRASAARPNNISALCGVGRAYMALGQHAAAIKSYQRALGMSPTNGLALVGLSDAYRRSGQTQLAVKNYKTYLSHHPIGPTAQRVRRNLKAMGVSLGPEDGAAKP
jgi:hypothetical protein